MVGFLNQGRARSRLFPNPKKTWIVVKVESLNWAMPKTIWAFWKPKKGQKVQFSGEFGRSLGEKGSSRFVTQCYIRAFSG